MKQRFGEIPKGIKACLVILLLAASIQSVSAMCFIPYRVSGYINYPNGQPPDEVNITVNNSWFCHPFAYPGGSNLYDAPSGFYRVSISVGDCECPEVGSDTVTVEVIRNDGYYGISEPTVIMGSDTRINISLEDTTVVPVPEFPNNAIMVLLSLLIPLSLHIIRP